MCAACVCVWVGGGGGGEGILRSKVLILEKFEGGKWATIYLLKISRTLETMLIQNMVFSSTIFSTLTVKTVI